MTETKNRIYLDYSATTPLDEDVLREMLPFLKEKFGNPSSIHSFGREAFEALEKSREKVAEFLNCFLSEIFFTGGATEANNLALFGTVKALQERIKNPHIITTQIEHPSVLNPCKELEKMGFEVTYIKPDREGIVKSSDIEKELRKNTVLVSVMYANNEIGTIQPIAEIANVIRDFRSSGSQIPVFHTDAVQAINYLNCDVQKLGVNLLTISGHKIYGPKGVGVLYVKRGTPVSPLVYGGGQENSLRSGTENIAGVVGLASALSKIKTRQKDEIIQIKKLRDKLVDGILSTVPEAQLNGSKEKRLPNNVNISIPGIEGEDMVFALDKEGIAVSTGF